MEAVVEAPLEPVESVAAMRFPAKADDRLRRLTDRNTNGQLSPAEKEQLEELVEFSEAIALVRAKALRVLGETRGLGSALGPIKVGCQGAKSGGRTGGTLAP